MGVMTVTVDEDVEKRFREVARARFGTRKGSIGKAVTEAVRAWSEKQEALTFTLNLLEKGRDLGIGKKKLWEKREELYARD